MSNIDDKLNEVLNIAEEVLDKKRRKESFRDCKRKTCKPAVVPQKLMLIQTLILVEENFTSY